MAFFVSGKPECFHPDVRLVTAVNVKLSLQVHISYHYAFLASHFIRVKWLMLLDEVRTLCGLSGLCTMSEFNVCNTKSAA